MCQLTPGYTYVLLDTSALFEVFQKGDYYASAQRKRNSGTHDIQTTVFSFQKAVHSIGRLGLMNELPGEVIDKLRALADIVGPFDVDRYPERWQAPLPMNREAFEQFLKLSADSANQHLKPDQIWAIVTFDFNIRVPGVLEAELDSKLASLDPEDYPDAFSEHLSTPHVIFGA